MKHQKTVQAVLLGLLAALLLPGCGGTEVTPVSKAPEATTIEAATSTLEAPSPTLEPPLPGLTTAPPAMELAISTTAFEPGGEIPVAYSCFGDNLSPALAWSGVPAAAQSLVLLMYDLDAGAASGASTAVGFAHWIVYDLPPGTSGMAENLPGGDSLPDGGLQGRNDFGAFVEPGDPLRGGAPAKVVGYDGPCPGAKHRYTFKFYALDAPLGLRAAAPMAELLAAMEGHVLAESALVGTFSPP